MSNCTINDTCLEIDKIKKLIVSIDESIDELWRNSGSFPCVEKNAKQLKAIVELLKMECIDI